MPRSSRANELVSLAEIADAYPRRPLPGLEPDPLPNMSFILPDIINILIRAFWNGEFEHPDVVRSIRKPPTRRAALADLHHHHSHVISNYITGFPTLHLEGATDERWFAFLGAVTYRDQDEVDVLEQTRMPRLMFWRWCQNRKLANPGAVDPRWQDSILSWSDANPLVQIPRRGPGRPRIHDYDDINRELKHLLDTRGGAVFRELSAVIGHLKDILGKESLPADSTLRDYVKKWIQSYLPGL